MRDERKLQIRVSNRLATHEIPRCPGCGSLYMTKRGHRKRARGELQKWECKKCRIIRSFPGPYLKKIRMPLKIVILILGSYINKLSSREIQEECRRRYGYYVSHTSVNRYINYVLEEGVKPSKAKKGIKNA